MRLSDLLAAITARGGTASTDDGETLAITWSGEPDSRLEAQARRMADEVMETILWRRCEAGAEWLFAREPRRTQIPQYGPNLCTYHVLLGALQRVTARRGVAAEEAVA